MKERGVSVKTVIAAMLMASGFAQAEAAQENVDKAKQLFQTCTACHTPIKEESIGPALHGIYRAKAGSVAGFDYSPAMRASHIVWNDKTLTAFLMNPQKVVQGTRMAFPGFSDPKDAAAVVTFLKTYK